MGSDNQVHLGPTHDCMSVYASFPVVVPIIAEFSSRFTFVEKVGPLVHEVLESAAPSGIILVDLDRSSSLDKHSAG